MSDLNIDPDSLLPGISDYVLRYAEEVPERLAMRSEYGEISYAELGERVNRLALALQRSGVKPGDRVAVLTTPRADAYTIFLALNAIGAIWLGINPVYQYQEMKYVVDDATPVALVFLPEFRGRNYLEDVRRLQAECDCLRQVYCLDREVAGPPRPGGAATRRSPSTGGRSPGSRARQGHS